MVSERFGVCHLKGPFASQPESTTRRDTITQLFLFCWVLSLVYLDPRQTKSSWFY